MPFKLTKEELQKREELIQSLQDLGPQIAENLSTYNQILRDAEEFRSSIEDRLRDEFDERSEAWQQSAAGEAAGEMIDSWENITFDEIYYDFQHAGDLEDLPIETT